MHSEKMVNTIQEKQIKENFKKDLDTNKIKSLNIFSTEKLNLINKEDFKSDLTYLISCSQNYYEDLIKIYSNNNSELVLIVNSDLDLEIEGTGILYILIENDCSLNLEFINNLQTNIFIKILVKEKVNFNLSENISNPNINKFIEIILLKNSNLKIAQFIFFGKITQTKVKLFENSISDLKSAYFIKENKIYIKNTSHHIKANSTSNIDVRGAVTNNSKVINDGVVKIEKNAINSKGIQNMKNLILDNKSKVISEPILEVFNREVICSHGSSISNISDEILFYMESKGILKEDTIMLFIDGFFNLALKNIENNKFIQKISSSFKK